MTDDALNEQFPDARRFLSKAHVELEAERTQINSLMGGIVDLTVSFDEATAERDAERAYAQQLQRAASFFVEWADQTILGHETAWALEEVSDYVRAALANSLDFGSADSKGESAEKGAQSLDTPPKMQYPTVQLAWRVTARFPTKHGERSKNTITQLCSTKDEALKLIADWSGKWFEDIRSQPLYGVAQADSAPEEHRQPALPRDAVGCGDPVCVAAGRCRGHVAGSASNVARP